MASPFLPRESWVGARLPSLDFDTGIQPTYKASGGQHGKEANPKPPGGGATDTGWKIAKELAAKAE
jgi:hypothetical protein